MVVLGQQNDKVKLYYHHLQTYLLYIIYMSHFNLQASISIFVDTEQEEQHLVISPEVQRQYSSEYNLIYEQIHKFLQECKQSVQRFVALHNFGVGFNLPALLGSLTHVDRVFNHNIEQKEKSPQNDPRQAAKHKYEQSFNKLILRMSALLTDIFDCEQEFKQNYFGQQKHQQKRHHFKMMSPRGAVNTSFRSSSQGSVGSAKLWVDEKQEEEHETALRNTLNKQLKPEIKNQKEECKEENTTTLNLYILNEKVDKIVQHMKTTRERQAKLIELFNMNRLKPQAMTEPTPAPSTAISINSDQEEMDQQLQQSCRFARKENDSYSQMGCFNEGRNFKKVNHNLMETMQ